MSSRILPWFPVIVVVVVVWPSSLVVGEGVPRQACTDDMDCDDNDPCTLDSCGPDSECDFVPNYNVLTECCNSTTGSLMLIECDENHCYDPICAPMGCDCCDRPDGDPCAGPQPIPAVSAWGLAVMCVVVLTAGVVVVRLGRRKAMD